MPGEEETTEVKTGEKEVTGDDTVTLSKEAYETLLASISEGADASRKVLSKVEQEEEDIRRAKIEEDRSKRATKYDDVKTPGEFAAMLKQEITEEIMQSAIQPVANTVMSIVVAQEIKDVKERHPDFDSHKDSIFKIVQDNPKLTIEDGYLIAVGKKPKEEKKETGDKKEVKPIVGGEKPTGAGKGSFEPTGKMTTKAAATAAYEKVFLKSSK